MKNKAKNKNAKPSQPSRRTQKAEAQPQSALRLMRVVNVCCAAALAIVAAALLACMSGDYLRRIDALSLFIYSGSYLHECMTSPAGFLSWASTFLTQAFAHPWLAALVYSALLIGLQLVSTCALRLPWRLLPLASVAPAMALSALLGCGYAIYSIKTPGWACNMPLGLTVAMLLVWRYRMQACAKDWTAWASPATLAAVCAIGYWLVGFYGLVATGLCAIVDLVMAAKRRDRVALRLVDAALAAALIVVVPKLWYHIVGGDLMRARTYLYGLPRLVDGEQAMRVPYIAACAALALLCLFTPKEKKRGGKPSWAAVAVCVAALASPFFMRQTDSNFQLTMRMQAAMDRGDWQRVLDLAERHSEPMTRLNSAMAHVAAYKLGLAGERTFAANVSGAPYDTPRELRVMHEAGAMPISYHLGFTNYAYRWAMESKVEYGASADQLKTMAKCALLNGEDALASKYLGILERTSHKKWARRYGRYVGHPELMAEDAELASIIPLMRSDSVFIEDHNRFEGYVWPLLANVEPDNPQQTDLSLQAALISQDLNAFSRNIELYAATHDAIPKAYQEAALAWDLVTDDNMAERLGVPESMKRRFEQFQVDTERYGNGFNPYMAQTYGDTFWFYLMYVDNIKII